MSPPISTVPSTVIVPPPAARVIRAFGDEVTVLLSGQETGGKYSMFSLITPPGGGPPPHLHQNEDEWFWVLEGHAEFFKDGAWNAVPVGSAIFTPRGVVHTFRNAGHTPLRMMMHTAPSGFETFFSRCADEFAKSAPPDMARIVAIAAEHGIHFATH